MLERLQKFMARCGVSSRRKCEEIILAGRVRVDDKIITELGYKVDPLTQTVYLDNSVLKPEAEKIYIALHKPEGYVSTVSDEKGRQTILDLVSVEERVYPIGRLDYDTSGLILLTNDGDIYNRVIHPRKCVNKVYIAEIEGVPDKNEIAKFCTGVDIGGYITAQADFMILNVFKNGAKVKITIHEGKNRQIRKMCDAINHPVMKLERVSVGEISLGNLPKGKWRMLTDKEVNYLSNL